MKLISKHFQHVEKKFEIKIKTCNKKIATAINLETGDEIKFNRAKLEWMIQKNIFKELKIYESFETQ